MATNQYHSLSLKNIYIFFAKISGEPIVDRARIAQRLHNIAPAKRKVNKYTKVRSRLNVIDSIEEDEREEKKRRREDTIL